MPEPEEQESEESSGPRPFWSGTITFGLVTVPVYLFPATRNQTLRFRLLTPAGKPVQRRYYAADGRKPLEREQMIRGFEVEPGKHVVVTEEELEKLAPKQSREIELHRFVDVAKLDPARADRPYILVPSRGTTKAYRLLAEVMERTHRAAIASFVLRGKEHLVAILAEAGILRAENLRFSDELRSPDDVGLPKKPKGGEVAKLAKQFEQALGSLAKKAPAWREWGDPHIEALRKLVERKREKGEDVVHAAQDGDASAPEIDLFEVLKNSLEGKKPGGPAKPSKTRAGAKAAPSRAAAKGKKVKRA